MFKIPNITKFHNINVRLAYKNPSNFTRNGAFIAGIYFAQLRQMIYFIRLMLTIYFILQSWNCNLLCCMTEVKTDRKTFRETRRKSRQIEFVLNLNSQHIV